MAITNTARKPLPSPFDPENHALYGEWRAHKMSGFPDTLEQLVVEVADPRRLTPAERGAILERCRKANMAIYVGGTGDDPDKDISHALGRAFGLGRLDHNWLADEDGLTSLTVSEGGTRESYIPYSNRAIQWHTDGYYNTADRQIRALNLHCVAPAADGGENQLLDHEIAYLLLRDAEPEFVRALMEPDVMTIPARIEPGGVARREQRGPVFSIVPETGDLHMRYTIRKHNIIWKDEPVTRAALAYLRRILDGEFGFVVKGRLESGMGLVSNNVLHDRAGFSDGENSKRLLYRARYYDRLGQTSVHQVYPELLAS